MILEVIKMKPRGQVWNWYHVLIILAEGPLAGQYAVADIVADGVAHAKMQALETYGESTKVTGVYRQGFAQDFYKAKKLQVPVFFEEEVDESTLGIR